MTDPPTEFTEFALNVLTAVTVFMIVFMWYLKRRTKRDRNP